MSRIRKTRAPRWKTAGALITLVLAAGWTIQAPAADATPAAKPAAIPPPLAEEFAKQEKIYRSRGADVPRGYVTGRTLSAYAELLPSGFSDALRGLRSEDRWLDIGAGGGQAILDYYAPEYDAAPCENCAPPGKARAVALSIEDRRTDQWWQRAASLDGNGMRYLSGKRLREYSREELGTFRIITDVYGGFSYTENLSLFLERVLGLLETNGSFYTLVASVRLEDGKDNPDKTWYLTELVDAAGRDVKVCSWLKSVSCVKVACESKSTWETPTELIHVRKVCGDVSVPRAKLLQYEAGNPPGRRFQLEPRADGDAVTK
jgi:SAM-dependent methyltransferase